MPAARMLQRRGFFSADEFAGSWAKDFPSQVIQGREVVFQIIFDLRLIRVGDGYASGENRGAPISHSAERGSPLFMA